MTTSNKSTAFGNLLKGAINGIANYEAKTAPIIEEELGDVIGVSGKTIQRYKTGYLPPVDRDNDAVRVLAEAAVRRGFLGREWLERFLHAARYPAADKLLDELCPAYTPRPKPERIYQNLPAPTYDQFVMRPQAFGEVIDGLSQRSAAVLIVGMGGNGKTSLAREVAAHCVQEGHGSPQFDAVVWVSDKDNPGTTNHSTVLDTIARTLDYPGFAQFPHEEKQYEVEQLLRRQRVLLIVDNAETITDGSLFSWLLRLPEPSKAIMTTREYQRAYRRGGWPVELRGMSDEEARILLQQRLERLRIAHLVTNPDQLEPLLNATGGNPKAITIVAGLLKYERRPLQQIIDDLYAARGDLFNDLFSRTWSLLDEVGKRILMVMTFFPDSASIEALSATANVTGFDFDRAVERLTDLSLLDVQQEDMATLPRYLLHPLVRAFAWARLAEQPDSERAARERWVGWYVELASKVGFCWNNLDRLQLIDLEEETVLAVIDWTFNNSFFAELFQLSRGTEYYFWVRGLWHKRIFTSEIHYRSAKIIGDDIEIAWTLIQILSVLSRRKETDLASQYIAELQERLETIDSAENTVAVVDGWAALGWSWATLGNVEKAEENFLRSTKIANDPADPACSLGEVYFAVFLYEQGRLDEARTLFWQALPHAQSANYIRNILYIKAYLAAIELDKNNIQAAEELLVTAQSLAYQHKDQGEIISIIKQTYARFYTMHGNFSAARKAIIEAIDLFERMGRRRELTEAREELKQLEAHIAATAE